MSKAISTIIPDDLKDTIEKIAKKKNISRNALIRLALSEYAERNK